MIQVTVGHLAILMTLLIAVGFIIGYITGWSDGRDSD